MAYTTINKSTEHFDIRTYSASGGGSVSDVAFQPDFLWFKNRTGAGDHGLMDAVRGITKILHSNDNDAEVTSNGSNDFTAFTSNGFNYGASSALDTGSGTPCNWLWKANGTGSANTSGSINSTVSANTTAGFSIGTYTGNATNNATVAHGLSSAPQMIIVKQRGSDGDNWQVYWNDGTERNGFLNLTNGFNTPAATQQWGDNVPTSSVFTLGSDTATNVAGNLVFYAFHSVQGYSKFGSYIGNGNADGTFVYTGFKPAFVMIKITDDTDNWVIYDNKRDGFNGDTHALFPNITDAQTTDVDIDLLSNGFKIVRASGRVNASGNLFIYMAFAEQPFVTSTGVPATAR